MNNRLKTADDDTPNKKLLITWDNGEQNEYGVNIEALRKALTRAKQILKTKAPIGSIGWITVEKRGASVQLFLLIDPPQEQSHARQQIKTPEASELH